MKSIWIRATVFGATLLATAAAVALAAHGINRNGEPALSAFFAHRHILVGRHLLDRDGKVLFTDSSGDSLPDVDEAGRVFVYNLDTGTGTKLYSPEGKELASSPGLVIRVGEDWYATAHDGNIVAASRRATTRVPVAGLESIERANIPWVVPPTSLTVRTKTGTGVMSIDGQWIIEPTFDRIYDFREGLAFACARGVDDLYGIIDMSGKWVVQPRFKRFGTAFSNGSAPVMTEKGWTRVDRNGNEIPNLDFGFSGVFTEGLLMAQAKDGKYGFVDASFKWAIPARFAWVNGFNEGLSAVADSREDKYGPFTKWTFIDRAGRIVLDLRHRDIIDCNEFHGGIAVIRERVANGEVDVVIDRQGKTVHTIRK